MQTRTDTAQRSRFLRELKPERFLNYDDYYLAIHLSSGVQICHVVGMLLGLGCLGLAAWQKSYWYLVPYLPCFIGIPQLSHWIFDGFWSPAIQDTRGMSLFMALRVNFEVMLGIQKEREKNLLEKYPFLKDYY